MSVWLLLSTLWATERNYQLWISWDPVLQWFCGYNPQNVTLVYVTCFAVTFWPPWQPWLIGARRQLLQPVDRWQVQAPSTSDLYTFICADGWRGWHEARSVPTRFGSPNTTLRLRLPFSPEGEQTKLSLQHSCRKDDEGNSGYRLGKEAGRVRWRHGWRRAAISTRGGLSFLSTSWLCATLPSKNDSNDEGGRVCEGQWL